MSQNHLPRLKITDVKTLVPVVDRLKSCCCICTPGNWTWMLFRYRSRFSTVRKI